MLVRICSTKHRHTNAFVFCTSTNVITLVFCVFCVCTDESLDGHFAYICSFSPHGGLPNKTHLNTSSKPWNRKAIKTTWKSRIWAFQGAFIEGSSLVLSWDMVVLVRESQYLVDLPENGKNLEFLHQTDYISDSEKARTFNGSSQKRWNSALISGLNICSILRCLICFSINLIWQSAMRRNRTNICEVTY